MAEKKLAVAAIEAAPTSSFDLSAIATAHEASEMTVVHPVTGDATDIRIKLYCIDNPQVKERQRKMQKSVLKLQKEKRDEEILDDADVNEMDMLVAATIGWRSDAHPEAILFNGNLMMFTADNVRHVYGEVPVISEQVRRFILDRANFMKG